MGDTKIPWATKTWPIVNGCTRVSPECENCWAAVKVATRLAHHPQYTGLATYSKATHRGKWSGEVRLDEKALEQPLHWRRPQHVFVAPHGDFFHEDVPVWFHDRAWEVMRKATQHTFLLLTKRPENMPARVPWTERENEWCDEPPWPNVWFGVTAGNQKMLDLRMPHLLKVPAALHFLSAEPLLAGLDVRSWLPETGGELVACATCGRRKKPYGRLAPRGSPAWRSQPAGELKVSQGGLCDEDCPGYGEDPLPGELWPREGRREFGYPKEQAEYPTLGWVIGGGESGPNARPCHPDAARGLRDQCKEVVPFMWKQNGKKGTGREIDGVEHAEVLPHERARH